MTISKDKDFYRDVVQEPLTNFRCTIVDHYKIYPGPTQRKLDPWDKMADALRVPRDMLRGTVTGRIPSGSPSEPTGIKGEHGMDKVLITDLEEYDGPTVNSVLDTIMSIGTEDDEQERKLEKFYPLPPPTYTKKQQPAAGPVATDQPNTYGEDKGKELSRAIGKTRLFMEATGWPMQEMTRLGQETISIMDKDSN